MEIQGYDAQRQFVSTLLELSRNSMPLSNSLNLHRYMRFCIQYFTIGRLPNILYLWSSISFLPLPVAVLWYDYTLTWTREVQYFWTKRFTFSTLLYVLCRYGMVANILYTLAIADKLPIMRVRFWRYWVVDELKHVSSILPCSALLSSQNWFDICIFASTVAMHGIESAPSWVFSVG